MSYQRSISGLGLSYDDVLILEQRLKQGYAGLHGAGPAPDYATDHAQWLREKSAYDQAYAAWTATMNQLSSAYSQAMAAYNAALAKYNADVGTYRAKLAGYQSNEGAQRSRQQAAMAAIKKQYPDVVFPAGFAGCVTQAEHDAHVANCSFRSTIKGLGATPSGNACGLAMLPVCPPPLTPPVWPGNPPVPPGKPVMPAGPAPLRPEPQSPPPASLTLPPPVQSVNPPPSSSGGPTLTKTPTTTAASAASGGLLSNGLILVVLAGGSYALYRTLRKPKAA